MKTLGGVTLPDSIEWIDKYTGSPVGQSVSRTLGGALVTFNQDLVDGVLITLSAQDEVCWLTQAEVDAIKALADQVGAQFVLNWEGTNYNVMFRHYEPPAFEVNPIWPHNEYYIGTIKLITV